MQIPVTCDPDAILQRRSIADLKAFQGSTKTLQRDQYDKLRNSIERHGFLAPVFVWDGWILDGHQRLHVCESEGWDIEGGVPVVEIEAKDARDAAEKLLLISSTYGKIDTQGLYEFTELHGLALPEWDIHDLPDFDHKAFLDEFYEEPVVAPSEDEVSDEPPEPVSLLGDLWVCGDHRILCGDCTDRDNIEQLFWDGRAHLGVTSPPYAVGKEYEADTSFAQHVALLEGVADRSLEAIVEGGFFFVNFGEIAAQAHAGPLTGSDRQCLYPISKDYWRIFHEDRGFDLYCQRIWYKPFNRLQQPFWSYKTSIAHYQEWEHLWTFRLPGGEGDEPHDWDISVRAVWDTRNESTSDKPLTRHVAAFPVGIPERALKAHSNVGDVIWEPFSGSGTTMVVCESLGRKCRGTELNPAYVDVAVLRWQDYTNQQAVLEGDGRTFAEISAERLPVLEKEVA